MRSLVVDAYAQCGPCVERCGTLVTPSSSLGLCPSQTSSHSRQTSVTRPDFTAGALGSSIPVRSIFETYLLLQISGPENSFVSSVE